MFATPTFTRQPAVRRKSSFNNVENWSEDEIREWSIIRMFDENANEELHIVVSVERDTEFGSTKVGTKVLNVSHNWLLKKIQLWAIKKAFA